MISKSLIDGISRLAEVDGTDEVTEIASEYFATTGFDAFNYGFADTRNAGIKTAPVQFISTSRSDWIRHYSERRYDLLDPGVKAIRIGDSAPTFIRAEIEREEANHSTELQTYLDDLLQAGGRSVVISPLRSPFLLDGSGFAGIGLMSSLTPDELSKLWRKRHGEILLFAMAMHEKMSPDVRRHADKVRDLSPRERDCLAFLSQGFRPQQIADRLMITPATVNLHIRSMRGKLRARTNAEAVAKALGYGLL